MNATFNMLKSTLLSWTMHVDFSTLILVSQIKQAKGRHFSLCDLFYITMHIFRLQTCKWHNYYLLLFQICMCLSKNTYGTTGNTKARLLKSLNMYIALGLCTLVSSIVCREKSTTIKLENSSSITLKIFIFE